MVDQLQVNKRIMEFDDRHGPSVKQGRWIYYGDGASRDINSLGPLIEPPNDPVQRCRNILVYRQAVLDENVNEFDRLKEELMADGDGWADEEANITKMEKRKRRIRWLRKRLAEAQEDLRLAMGGPTEREDRVFQQIDADTEAARHRYRARLEGIHT